jgi:hypothetical protein
MQSEEPTPAPFIEWLPTNCAICDASLAECISRLPPARIYTIYCGQRAFAEARYWFRFCFEKNSAFTPQVNLCVEPMAKPDEWVLEAGGKRVGSHGVNYGT